MWPQIACTETFENVEDKLDIINTGDNPVHLQWPWPHSLPSALSPPRHSFTGSNELFSHLNFMFEIVETICFK